MTAFAIYSPAGELLASYAAVEDATYAGRTRWAGRVGWIERTSDRALIGAPSDLTRLRAVGSRAAKVRALEALPGRDQDGPRPPLQEGRVTLKTCAREGCKKTFDDPPRRWTQPRLYCSPECRNAVGYAREKAKKTMAKEIEETTTDDAPEEAPRRRTTEEVEQAVLATLGRKPKRLADIIEESGVCRSSVCRILKALVEAGQASRHPGGAYSLPGGKVEPVPKPRAKKPAPPAESPEPAPEAPAEDDTFSAEEMAVVLRLAAPGLRALLEKIDRYT